MNEATHRAWGVAVKGCAGALALSLAALLAQLGHAFWQATTGAGSDERGTPVTVVALHGLPIEARHLARLGRAALDGVAIEDEFRSARSLVGTQVQQLMMQMAATELQAQVQPLISAWAELETAAGRLYASLGTVQEMAARERQWFEQEADFKAQLDALAREMVASGAVASQVYLALHQLVLLDEISARVDSIRSGNERAVLAAAELTQEVAAFARVLTGLQRGDAGIALRRLQGRRTRIALAQVMAQWEALRPLLDDIAQHAPTRMLAHSAVVALERGADTLLDLSGPLAQRAAAPPPLASPGIARLWVALGTGALTLLSGIGLWQALLRRRRHWNEHAALQRHREQDAFAQLLDEMGALAEGDLTVKATFSEGSAGALADAINFVTQQLGARIQGMTAAAAPIAAKSEQALGAAIQLSEVSQYQREELDAALAKVQQLSLCVSALAAQMVAEDGPDRQAVQIAANECAHACVDLAAMLGTAHTVTARLAGEAAQAVEALDTLAQSAAALSESADGFVLPS